MLRAVLFDVDGVLIDSPVVHAAAWAKIFKPYGIELPPEVLHEQEGRKSIDIAHEIVNNFNLSIDDEVLYEMIDRKRQDYRRHAPHGLRKDAKSAIAELKARGWRIGLVSGSVKENIQAAIPKQELELFDVRLMAGDYSRGKPEPDPFLIACEKLNLTPRECVVIENAPLGITSAKSAGMIVYALTSTLKAAKLADADFIIDDLFKLSDMLGDPH